MADKPNDEKTKTNQDAPVAEAKQPAPTAEAQAAKAEAAQPEVKAEDKAAKPKVKAEDKAAQPEAQVVKAEKPKPDAKPKPAKKQAETKPISAELKKLAEQLVKLNVLEVSQLADYLKSEYGLEPAAAAVVASGGGGAAAGGEAGGEAAAEAKSEYTVTLKDAGAQKIAVIKAVKDITGLGLGESKAITDEAPKTIKENVAKDEAEEIKAKLEEAGATVELS